MHTFALLSSQMAGLFLCRVWRNQVKGAILIDAGHFREVWKQRHAPRHEASGRPKNHVPPANAVRQTIQAIQSAVRESMSTEVVRWLRTYYYDAEPFGDTIHDPGGTRHAFSEKALYENSVRLLDDLRRSDHIAVRLGRTKFSEWRQPTSPTGAYSPVFQQKGVDMKIGLDMALLATKRIVDVLILVTNDTDFVSPMKLVRSEGVVVGIYSVVPVVAPRLNEHADIVFRGKIQSGV